MKPVEFYFDYICPFCYRSFQDLLELKKEKNDLVIDFHPCEIHPRPERHGKHSDLCIQGMFLAKDLGVDLWEYNQKIFHSHFVDRINIEEIQELANAVKDLIEPDLFVKEISSSQYADALKHTNTVAFSQHKIEVVPHYISEHSVLPSVEGIGISKKKLDDFIRVLL